MKVSQEHVTHPDESLRFLRFEAEGFRGQRHRHRHVELTWIESGSGLRFLGDSAAPFESGDLVLVGVETPHAWVSGARRRRAAPDVASVIQFSPELLAQPLLPELARAAPLVARARLGLAITGDCALEVQAVLQRLRHADRFGRLAGLVEILGRLVAHEGTLATIAHSAMQAAAPEGREADAGRRIERVIAWIHRHHARTLRVDEAARIANVTPAAFSRFFRREVGKTFTAYLNDLRCSAACVRLRGSARPVAAIAHECGFETLSHFNQQFRLRTGMTPREFRGEGA